MEKPEVSEFDSVDPAPASEVSSVKDLRATRCVGEGRSKIVRLVPAPERVKRIVSDVKNITIKETTSVDDVKLCYTTSYGPSG